MKGRDFDSPAPYRCEIRRHSMKQEIIDRKFFTQVGIAALVLVLGLVAGCKSHEAARTDQQIAQDIQSRIQAEQALAGQNIQVAVASGVATLNGSVTDEASRSLAANDSSSINGVKTVVNNLTVQQAQPAAAPAAAPVLTPGVSSAPAAQRPAKPAPNRSAPPVQQAQAVAPHPVQQAVSQPAPQPEPPKPVVRDVTLPAGTVIPVRITETLDSKDAQANDVFHGSVAGDLGTPDVIAIPHGSSVMGRIVDAREAAHFKGNALLTIELTQVAVRGQKVVLVTDSYSKEGAGRGKNTVAKAAGGAVVGSIIGALAGGGKGAAIGGMAGGAAGTGVNAATRGQQAVIPAETLINFRLQSPLTVRVTVYPQGSEPANGSSSLHLERR
jgi:hypothetical protein